MTLSDMVFAMDCQQAEERERWECRNDEHEQTEEERDIEELRRMEMEDRIGRKNDVV